LDKKSIEMSKHGLTYFDGNWARFSARVKCSPENLGTGNMIFGNVEVTEVAVIGNDNVIGHNCFIAGKIGSNCKIQGGVFIPEGVVIGDNVFIGPNTTFCNVKYPNAKVPNKSYVDKKIIDVRSEVVIGANCTILPNVSLFHGCFIGAGSVVTKDVVEIEKVCGNPAKPMRSK